MATLTHLTAPLGISSVLSRKYIKLDALLTEYLALLARESELDDLPAGREKRHLLENLYHETKLLDARIGKVWDTLSGSQQVELFNRTPSDVQHVFDGF